MLCKFFLEDHIKILFLIVRRTFTKEANFVHIAKTLSKYSPVSILLRYMHEAKLTPQAICCCSVQSRDFLIRELGKCSRKLLASRNAIGKTIAFIVYVRVGLLQS